MDNCQHTVTQSRGKEKGSWCVECGEKILSVETRPCEDCKHFAPRGKVIGICQKKRFTVTNDLLVTFHTSRGTCFEQLRKGGES